VRRDEARNLIAEQVEAFDRLRARLEMADKDSG
jgi:putative heme iron utilization protein